MLQCDGTGHNLIKAADQSVDGEAVVNRKGGLYLCENFEVVGIYIYVVSVLKMWCFHACF